MQDGPSDAEELTLEVSARALTRVALMVFAVPLAALLAGAWMGRAAADVVGTGADMTSGLAGLACLATASAVMAGNGSAMVGMLNIRARCRRTDS